MRCKPDQMAMVTGGQPLANRGCVITVRRHMWFSGQDCWTFEGELRNGRCDPGEIVVVADDCLTPINDPGLSGEIEAEATRPTPIDTPATA